MVRRRRIVIVCLAVIIVCVVMGPFALSWIRVEIGLPSETTNVWQYSQVKRLWPSKLVKHFPERIPGNAQDVRLSAHPGFLQGGAHFQLSYRLPADQIRQLLIDFESQARSWWQSDETSTVGLPNAQYFGEESDTREFPNDFKVLFLWAKAYFYFDGVPNWNHGHSYGVAISLTQNRIVYWAEN